MKRLQGVRWLLLALPAAAWAAGDGWLDGSVLDSAFGIGSEQSVMLAKDLGLVNGQLTLNGWKEDVANVRELYAPPYFSKDFYLEVLFDDRCVKADSYYWRPDSLVRRGNRKGWAITTELVPLAHERAAMLAIRVRNDNPKPASLTVSYSAVGTVGQRFRWEFNKPTDDVVRNAKGVFGIVGAPDARIAVASTFGDAVGCYTVAGKPTFAGEQVELKAVPPGAERVLYVVQAIGSSVAADRVAAMAIAEPAAAIAAAKAHWRQRVRGLAAKMPDFRCDDPALEKLYRRSLLHLLLVEWRTDALKLNPYYSTGGVNGGCFCNYLWNFGGPYRIWPLADPAAFKEHLKTYLALDLENCFAFAPADGSPLGPYYMINQEKILLLIDAYVRETGDLAFLQERFNGRTFVEWAVKMALTHDDLTQDAVLKDYGKSNSHLELRKGDDLYNGVMPDLNLRRVALLRMAARLCRMTGYDPGVDLERRADALRRLCREELWDAEAGWFRCRCADGESKLRWTMQMFKAFGGGALDPEVEAAMLKHLMNPQEFLGDYGVHSLSKLDPAYDESDPDNGGPGACPSFAPAICDRLYRDGHVAEANAIMMRLRWLADAMPYWGDSQYADRRDYNHLDTPLQCNVESLCIAQTIAFGMFGVTIADDLSVKFDPHLPDGVSRMSLTGLRLGNRTYEISQARGEPPVVKVK